jgi:hypothetical protein
MFFSHFISFILFILYIQLCKQWQNKLTGWAQRIISISAKKIFKYVKHRLFEKIIKSNKSRNKSRIWKQIAKVHVFDEIRQSIDILIDIFRVTSNDVH